VTQGLAISCHVNLPFTAVRSMMMMTVTVMHGSDRF
jgi:hypothetical protein